MSLKGREEFIEEDGGCPRLVYLFKWILPYMLGLKIYLNNGG